MSKGDNQLDKLSSGNIPLISSGFNNNGIIGFINKGSQNSQMFPKNVITVDMFGKPFFQTYNFYSVSHGRINILLPREKMVYSGFFIVKMLEQQSILFSYNNMASSSRLNRKKIILPVLSNGKPNWNYMEQYIVNIMKNFDVPKLEPIKSKLSYLDLNSSKWALMTISQIFESIKRGKRLTKSEQQPGIIPYISSTALNNGVDSYIATPNKRYRSFTNFIGVNNSGSVGQAFYHEYTTIVSDHVTALSHEKLNKYNAPFLITCLEQSLHGNFSFNREISDTRFSRQKILVPITNSGKIDWKFMEEYIKSISNSHLL